jgi:hypothetical protein
LTAERVAANVRDAMFPLRAFVGLCFASHVLGACATTSGAFDRSGYWQKTYGYRVGYADPSQQRLMGAEWRLDNLRLDTVNKQWVDKDGPDYKFERQLDENGDGVISAWEVRKEAIFDLRLVNVRDSGVIWIKAHPLAHEDAARELDVILKGYANELSGTGFYASTSVFSEVEVKTRQYISFVTRREPVTVGPNLGVLASIELAEVERLRLDPAHRASRLKVVFSKIAYQRLVNARGFDAPYPPTRWPTAKCGEGLCEQRCALLVMGYINAIEHFDAHTAEFDGFLKQVTLPPATTLPAAWRPRPVAPLAATAPAAAPAPPPPPAP